MKKTEILAPAGHEEVVYAAVKNGANAIYLGGKAYSARANASNFDLELLEKMIIYCHERNVAVYVTVNTLFFDEEIADVMGYIKELANINVDAIIFQDMAIANLVDFVSLHASTQLTIHSEQGAKFFKKLNNVERIVTARENDLATLKAMVQTDIEIETFIHGALCVCYSGQCLFSSHEFNRSGNRGSCAQPCRLGYKLYNKTLNKSIKQEGEYLLSPKDLCTIENINQLIDIGIRSLKIEGRMKKPEYVAIVVSKYNQMINQNKFTKQDRLELLLAFNRQFTKGHILNDFQMNIINPSNQGYPVAKIIGFNKNKKRVVLKLLDNLNQYDGIRINNDDGLVLHKIYQNDLLVNSARSGEVVEIELRSETYRKAMQNDLIYKMASLSLSKQIELSYKDEKPLVAINGFIKAVINQKLQLKLIDLKTNKQIIIESDDVLVEGNLSLERIKKQIAKLGNTYYYFNDLYIEGDENIYLSIAKINELRRIGLTKLTKKRIEKPKKQISLKLESLPLATKKQPKINVYIDRIECLDIINQFNFIDTIYYPLKEEFIDINKLTNKNTVLKINDIIENHDEYYKKNKYLIDKSKALLISDFGSIEYFFDKKLILDFSFNVTNSYALAFYKKYANIIHVTLSYELNQKQVNNLSDGVKKEQIIYSKKRLMVMKHCLISNKKQCGLCKLNNYQLHDFHNRQYDIITDNDCNNYLYTNKAVKILAANNVEYLRLQFFDEVLDDVKNILEKLGEKYGY